MSDSSAGARERGAIARVIARAHNRGLSGAAALALSLLACYGTLVLVAAFAWFGVALAPDETLWIAFILAFALLAVIAVGAGMRRHGSALPVVLAVAGAALLAYVMVWRYDRVLELLAFALIAIAAFTDFRLCTRLRCAPRPKAHDD